MGIELQLLRLVMDYSLKGKLVDRAYIEKLVDIVVSNKDLHEYVRSLTFTDKLEKSPDKVTCGGYNFLRHDVTLDYESLMMLIDNRSYHFDCLFNPTEQIVYRNLVVTQTILHELVHAYQDKKADDKSDNSVEAKLIRASIYFSQLCKNPKLYELLLRGKLSIDELKKMEALNFELYHQYYDYDPVERMAQAHSYKMVVSMLEPVKKQLPSLYEFENATYGEELLKSYEESWNQGLCPSHVYLANVGQKKAWTSLDFYDADSHKLVDNVISQFELVKRLYMGLPITFKEFTTVDDWVKSSNKFSF